MKHLAAYVAAFVLIAFAAALLWAGHAGLTNVDKGIITLFVLLAVALAARADFTEAAEALKPYLPWIKPAAS